MRRGATLFFLTESDDISLYNYITDFGAGAHLCDADDMSTFIFDLQLFADTIEGLTYNDGGYYEIGSSADLNAIATYVNGGSSITYRASTENEPTKLFTLKGIISTEGIGIDVVNISTSKTNSLIRFGKNKNILVVKESNSFTGTAKSSNSLIHCDGNLTIIGDGTLTAKSTNASSEGAVIGDNKNEQTTGIINIGGSVKVDITNDSTGSCIGVGSGDATCGAITIAGKDHRQRL